VSSSVRRSPRQARSLKRFQALLDAAALLFAERGFDGTTTEEIAARAGTPIGSLYQFFPNKGALFQALAERCLERSRVLVDAFVGGWDPTHMAWTERLDSMIDGLVALRQQDPAFRAILVNVQLYGMYAEADHALHQTLIKNAAKLIGKLAPHQPPSVHRRVAIMVVQVVTATLFFSAQERGVAKETIEETKVLLRRYLEPVLATPGGGKKG
jgi:AcrR family transcriptional regulator